jgi:hypothetical protein
VPYQRNTALSPGVAAQVVTETELKLGGGRALHVYDAGPGHTAWW